MTTSTPASTPRRRRRIRHKDKPKKVSGKNVSTRSVSIRLRHEVVATLRARGQAQGISLNAMLVAMVDRELVNTPREVAP